MQIDSRLENCSFFVCDLKLSQVRLHKNATYPWIMLIPKRNDITEIIQLSDEDQHQLMHEIALSSQIMQALFAPEKLNVAALGNVVAQLHIHIVARYNTDPAWPDPIWGKPEVQDYSDEKLDMIINTLKKHFHLNLE